MIIALMRRAPLIFLCALFLGACSQAHNDPVARGRAWFASYECKKCHRVGREGGTLGPDLSFVGFRKSPEFLETWLKDPHSWKNGVSMPNFYFQEPVRKDLVAYLSSLKGEEYGDKRPWRDAGGAAQGELIYKHAGCVTCHGKGGEGGYPNNNVVGGLIPPVKLAADGFSRTELIAKISEGVRHPGKADPAGAEPLLYMPKWSEALAPEEIAAVADYLLSLKPAAAGGDEW